MTVTLFILMCAAVAVMLMGKAYSVIQRDAFGLETTAFSMDNKDYVTVFGKEMYFPLVSIIERVIEFFEKYCSGIIKLLKYVIDTIKELGNVIIR